MSKNLTVRYVGGGAYRAGVPARDMTEDEWLALDEAEREACLALGLYEVDEPTAPKKASKKETMTDDID